MKILALLPIPFLLAACQVEGPRETAGNSMIAQGRALAQANCSGCHAIGPSGTSNYSEAPTFSTLVNQKGATAETLSAWLREAHNYPQEMDLYLLPPQADALAAYMLTLKQGGHHQSRTPTDGATTNE
ncbi:MULTISPECIES: c-type cytochrome [unclassified Sphingomonas]|uniref:c-type cytochrome n=1 Tax=unclassified Sphingomonas TaxID=196159 RepID=UPI001D0FC5C3|nr:MULTISPECIES: cytochrome c [unclassified Sphingomonas]MCC2978519.1 cytochrome c [Sphingomonas sp. IC4-52]MCD2316195.1 cytochrome c [Sphingomonas sp. IC-11]